MDVELFVDIANVKPNRIDAHRECVGGGLVNVAIGQQPQHLDFTSRQLTVFGFGRDDLLKHLNDLASDFGSHRSSAVAQFADGFEQSGRRRVLEQVAACSGADGLENVFVVRINSQHQYVQRGVPGLEQPHAFDAAYSGKADIG